MNNEPFILNTDPIIAILVRAKALISQDDVSFTREKRRENQQSALALYTKLLHQFGESSELLAAIANCNLMLESTATTDEERMYYYDQAVDWAKKAVNISPDKAWLRAFLGCLHIIAHVDYGASAEEYRKAIALSPCDASIYAQAAFFHDHHSPDTPVPLQESIGWLERAVQLDPDKADYHALLGRLYYEAGRKEEAAKAWIAALLSCNPLQLGYLQDIKSAFGIK